MDKGPEQEHMSPFSMNNEAPENNFFGIGIKENIKYATYLAIK